MDLSGVYQGCSPYDCVICCSNVKTSKITNKINDNGEPDATIITKLQFIAPEIEWCQEPYICETCTGDLLSACMFKERCLKSQHLHIKTEPVDEDYSYPEIKLGYEDKDNDIVNFEPPSEEEIRIETHYIKDTMEDGNNKECNKCGIKYSSVSSLETHELLCDGIIEQHDKSKTQFKCYRCNKFYTTYKILKAHIKSCELETANLSANQCVDLDCDQSLIREQEELMLDRQSKPLKRNNRIERFLCEVCQAKFTRLKDILKHCETKHSMDVKTVKPYLCETCNARFRASMSLRIHQQRHIGYKSYLCTYCGKRFITSKDLSLHEIIHSDIRAFKCDLCDKTFKTNSNLRNHKFIVHTTPSEWKHICNICGKRFPQKTVLGVHVRRHLGKKNFICHICDKSFITKHVLNEHLASHSNVSAFKCELCKKEYRHQTSYKRHLKKMHEIGSVKLPTRENKLACQFAMQRFHIKEG